MKKLPELLQNQLGLLEALLLARRLVHARHCTLEEAAAELEMSPAALEAVSPDGFTLEEIAEFLGVSHQYLSTVCLSAFEKIRRRHPELREELRAA